ncbi:hypothetical protein, partial [Streptomyces drozdowiczii]
MLISRKDSSTLWATQGV